MNRVAVFASGRGSNFEALLNAEKAGKLHARIVLLLSDQEDAGALDLASRFDVPSIVVPAQKRGRLTYGEEQRYIAECRAANADWICLAGFMRIIGDDLIKAWPERILNIHPSLLPAFPGLDAQAQAWDYGVRFSGCTVHLVDEGVDTGPIVMQTAVQIDPAWSPDQLADAILTEEHKLYAESLNRLLTRKWRIEGRRIVFSTERRTHYEDSA